MTATPRRLRAVPVSEDCAGGCMMVCQATLSGPQPTRVQALTPVTGPGGPHIAVRVGSVLLLISDQQAMDAVTAAVRQANSLADAVYGTRRN